MAKGSKFSNKVWVTIDVQLKPADENSIEVPI